MPTAPVPPEKPAEIADLEQAIREAVDAEIRELAANLAHSDDAHRFGENEFKIRALAASPPPALADAAADRLRDLQPGLAHLVDLQTSIDG